MSAYPFTCSLSVRYADIDAQGHVNNAVYFTYMEQARLEYLLAAGLWRVEAGYTSVSTILAEAACTFRRPILLGQPLTVGVRVARLGNKSLEMEYELRAAGELAAVGRSVLVTYDYAAGASIPIPPEWRARIQTFEGH